MFLIKHKILGNKTIESKFTKLSEVRAFITTIVMSRSGLTFGQDGNFQVFKLVGNSWEFCGAEIFNNKVNETI
jgi:hypothetical protein